VAAASLGATSSAWADCPGALGGDGSCPYTTLTQIGQRTGGVLRFPQAVAVGADGSVIVGDQGTHAIQAFGPDGTFRGDVGMAGTRPGQLTAVGGLAVAPDGTVYVADAANRIDRFAPSGTYLGSFGGPGNGLGQFAFGSGVGNTAGAGGGVAVSGGAVYVADTGNDRVQRFHLDGSGAVEIVPPGTLAFPQGLAVRGSRLLVADDQNHRLAVFDTGGHPLSYVGSGKGAGPGQLQNPYDVATDATGKVFVADDMNQRIVRFSSPPGYRYKARWGSYGTQLGQLAYPRGIAVGANGLVYVADTGDDRIDVFQNDGTYVRSFGTSGRAPGQFNTPTGVAADASGIRAVTDSVNGRLELFNPDGSVAAVWGSPNPGPTILPDPVGVAFTASGDADVLDQRRSRIVVFSRATGQPATTIGSPGSGPGQMLAPSAIALDAAGTIYVADTGNERIARFGQDGSYLGSITQIGSIRGIAVAPDGSRIYAATSDNHITVYGPDGTQLADFGGTGNKLGKLNSPGQMVVDGDGNLWVADRGNSRVQKFGPNGERLLAFGQRGTGPGQFIHPADVAIDCRGTLTVTDEDNNRVQQFALGAPPAGTGSCASLPAPFKPPPPQEPTLPAPVGPQLSVRVLRTTRVVSSGMLPIRIGCDTRCTLTVTGTVAPTAKPPKHHKPVSVKFVAAKRSLGAGQSALLRLALSSQSKARLAKALRRTRGLLVDIQIVAQPDAGTATTQSERLNATS